MPAERMAKRPYRWRCIGATLHVGIRHFRSLSVDFDALMREDLLQNRRSHTASVHEGVNKHAVKKAKLCL
jgi:hypothetical protein